MVFRKLTSLIFKTGLTSLLLLGLVWQPASAHILDSDLMVQDAAVGPYFVSVWTVASGIHPTSVHLSAQVSNAAGEPLPVAASHVQFTLAPVNEGEPPIVVEPAPFSTGDKFLHEANIELHQPGQFQVLVEVTDLAGVGGQVTYDLDLSPPSLFAQAAIIVFMIVGIIAMLWLLKEGLTTWRKPTHPITVPKGEQI